MCNQGKSRFCFICLLLYILLPNLSGENVPIEDYSAPAMYSPLTEKDNSTMEDTSLHQLKDPPQPLPLHQAEDYFNKLAKKYGNGVNISLEGFEHLLQNLGLGNVIITSHNLDCHKEENSSNFVNFHENHNHSGDASVSESYDNPCSKGGTEKHMDDHADKHAHEQTDDHDHTDEHAHEHTDDHDHTDEHDEHTDSNRDEGNADESKEKRSLPPVDENDECLSVKTMMQIAHSADQAGLNKEAFKQLCPSLIIQIDSDTCHRYHTNTDHHHDDHHTDSDHHHDDSELHDYADHLHVVEISNVSAKVWGFSSIAVVIISLVGLLGVAVIPIMQKVFYNHMLQFLVAMAVGALSGDALLHLLPHAISGGHGHSEHETHEPHSMDPVLKGLCGLMGIYLFFLIERVVTIVTELKRRKKFSDSLFFDLAQKSSCAWNFISERVIRIFETAEYCRMKSKNSKRFMKEDNLEKVGEKLAHSECDEMMMSIHPNKALQGYADEAHSEHCMISFENTTSISHEHGHHNHHSHNNDTQSPDADEGATMISHSHGHSHCQDDVPTSVSAIAWMVILGDGIHNFSDGLAIGAAFANSITGGFSTSIAVFCHELPHEIGDFAMLLRAGMSAKQAIIYNCLSSVLSFIGMLIGVAIGNIENASLWIFAVVGGMFLYIALVDMLPELSSVDTKKGENPFCHLFLQCVGMLLGAGIMLVIALYEDRLSNILD